MYNTNPHRTSMSGDLLQSDGWERFQRALGRTTHRVGGVLSTEMPLPFGLRYLYAPRTNGELIMDSGELSNIVRTTRAVFLRLEVDSQLSTINYQLSTPRTLRRALEPEWTWRTSLDGTDDDLLARMHEKYRYNIRLATKRGVMVRVASFPPSSRAEPQRSREISGDRSEISPLRSHPARSGRNDELGNDFDAGWSLLQDTARRQGIATHPRKYYEIMLRELPQTSLYIAEREGAAIAASIVTYHGDTATYLHGGSAHDHRQYMAPHLLHWYAMRDAKGAGMRWYEWGGISPPRAGIENGELIVDNSSWSGITRFKMGFGGEAVHHPPTCDLVFRRGWYTMLSALARLRG